LRVRVSSPGAETAFESTEVSPAASVIVAVMNWLWSAVTGRR
jgi:hypothetical protein